MLNFERLGLGSRAGRSSSSSSSPKMNSLFRSSRTAAALLPSRHAFTSTSAFCTSAPILAPERSAREASAASKLLELVDGLDRDGADMLAVEGEP